MLPHIGTLTLTPIISYWRIQMVHFPAEGLCHASAHRRVVDSGYILPTHPVNAYAGRGLCNATSVGSIHAASDRHVPMP